MARDARRTDPQAHARASSKGGGGAGGMGTAEASGSAGMGGGAGSYMPATIQLYIQLSVNWGWDPTPAGPSCPAVPAEASFAHGSKGCRHDRTALHAPRLAPAARPQPRNDRPADHRPLLGQRAPGRK